MAVSFTQSCYGGPKNVSPAEAMTFMQASKLKGRANWLDGVIEIASLKKRVNFWTVTPPRQRGSSAAPSCRFPLLARGAKRLLCCHCTTGASERNWKVWGQIYTKYRAAARIELGKLLVYIKANSKSSTGGGGEFDTEMGI